MRNERPVRDGIEGFRADLDDLGTVTDVRRTVVTFEVLAVAGALAGRLVLTGVGVDELGGWPAVPPHWIHLPAEVKFAASNVDASNTLPGWQRHSRQIGTWDMSTHPGQAWLAHVRAVVSMAG
jgi:hypothetical protein